jgi:ribosomal protein L12E/L44/L45/RPP1/RPP2
MLFTTLENKLMLLWKRLHHGFLHICLAYISQDPSKFAVAAPVAADSGAAAPSAAKEEEKKEEPEEESDGDLGMSLFD